MIGYEIHGEGISRILVVQTIAANRWRFYQIKEGKRIIVKLKQAGGKCFAVVSDKVLVFSKPHPAVYHKEYIRQNARAQWMGGRLKPDMIMDNMLEYIEII